MSKSWAAIVGLLVATATTQGLSQTAQTAAAQPATQQTPAAPIAEGLPPPSDAPQTPSTGTELVPPAGHVPQGSPPTSQALQGPPSQEAGPAGTEENPLGKPIDLNPSSAALVTSLDDFQGYRTANGSLSWTPGGGNQFGMFSIAWDHYQPAGLKTGFDIGADFNFLSGPDNTDMPPRTYDFSLGFQTRDRLGPLTYDVSVAVLAASDFVGSARQGILFPSHAVGFLKVDAALDLVLGVDFLNRGDVKVLPVVGLICIPAPEIRLEILFPRPRAVYQLTDRNLVYLSGELGGDTWAIWRAAGFNDLATYHDLRLCLGLEYLNKGGPAGAIEVGYLFDRRIEYSSGIGNMPLDDAVMLSLVTRY